MEDPALAPHRVEVLGRIMSGYGAHLQKNDRLVLGVEGDPLRTYKSTEEENIVIVDDVKRESDGYIEIDGHFEKSGSSIKLNNRSFDPRHVWELYRGDVDGFSERVRKFRGVDNTVLAQRIEEVGERMREIESATTSRMNDMTTSLATRVAAVEEDVSRNFRGTEEAQNVHAFRETITSVLYGLANDNLHLSRGEPLEFSPSYLEQYHKKLKESDTKLDNPIGDRSHFDEEFRSTEKRKGHESKWNFDEEFRASTKEASNLTDEDEPKRKREPSD